MLESCFDSPIQDLNGAGGANSLSFSLTTIVSLINFEYILHSCLIKHWGIVVMTKLKEKDGVVKYHVNRRVNTFLLCWLSHC